MLGKCCFDLKNLGLVISSLNMNPWKTQNVSEKLCTKWKCKGTFRMEVDHTTILRQISEIGKIKKKGIHAFKSGWERCI